MKARHDLSLLAATLGLVVLFPGSAARGQEFWSAGGGALSISVDENQTAAASLRIGYGDRSVAADAQGRVALDYLVDDASSFSVAVDSAAVIGFLGGELLPHGALSIASSRGTVALEGLIIVPATADSPNLRITDATHGGESGLLLHRVKAGVNAADGMITIHSPELRISPALAERLGDPGLTDLVLGSVTIHARAEWIGGREPATVESPAPGGEAMLATGPDMQFCQLYGLQQFGREADVVGLALATTSHNVGDEDVMWFNSPAVEHPFIVMNMFRLKNDQFEQIGQSWIKHGFYALGNTQCGGSCTFEPGHGPGDWLGQGCTDTYGASLNASQSGLGPRYEINPWTGVWVYAGSHFDVGGPPHNNVSHMLQVNDADLDPAQNFGATYYAEGYYAILDDVNVMNSASWKPVTVSGAPGGTWSFSMSGAGTLPNHGFAIEAWTGTSRIMIAEDIPVIEFVSPDGRCVLSAKTTDLGGGNHHYEYALLNIDMDRKVDSFSLPVPVGTQVSNVGFHAVLHHDEGAAGYSNTPWTSTVGNGEVRWDTTDNPVRWGTLYNFRFDTNTPPDPGGVSATLGMFEPGTPATLSGRILGPTQGPPDCNTNGVPDDCDLDCNAPGCTPPCETSTDCNTNGVPDECDPDCNSNGTPDDCEAFADCNGNSTPDECEPDCNTNGVPDDCDVDVTDPDGNSQVSPDCNTNGTPDECDVASGFSDDCDTDGVPDECESDGDGDGWIDNCDNCPGDYNPSQADFDFDGVGDACDPDCNPLVLDDHFETDQGWTVENVLPLGGGAWERGDPAGTGSRGDPTDDFDGGGQCYLTENVAGDSDVDGGPTRLFSPVLDMGDGAVTLSYAYWYSHSVGDDPTENLIVEASTNGTAWVQLASHGGMGSGQWETNSVLLNDFMTPGTATQIRFSVEDTPNNSIIEAAVDAVLITSTCYPAGNSLRGGVMWDKWWPVTGATEPVIDHPLWQFRPDQTSNPATGSATWRCKECHGWDYKGVDGQYGTGSHRTGFPGVLGSITLPSELETLLTEPPNNGGGPGVLNGHDYGSVMAAEDILDLVAFAQHRVIDDSLYINAGGVFGGSPAAGDPIYTSGTSPACRACHGDDGTGIDFGSPGSPEYLGTMAAANPWELLHKIRFGEPGVQSMPELLSEGFDDQDAADLGTYIQATTEFLTGVVGDWDKDLDTDLDDFGHWESCVTGPDAGPYPAGCGAFDANGDGDVDLDDQGAFQRARGG